eukprot:963969-Pyramimonas_sp.AAC.1
MVYRELASAAVQVESSELTHRMCGRRLGVALPGGIPPLSVYCETSVGAKGNANLFSFLAKLVLSLDVIWRVWLPVPGARGHGGARWRPFSGVSVLMSDVGMLHEASRQLAPSTTSWTPRRWRAALS